MRLILFAFILVLVNGTGSIYAQSTDSVKHSTAQQTVNTRKNELKINLLYGVLGIAEITYERVVGDNQGLGASVVVGFDDDTNYNFSFLPYYRMYFGKKTAAGFFIEANAGLLNYQDDTYYYTSDAGYFNVDHENKMSFGAGVAVGGKFLNKNGLFGEIYTGIGRLFDSSYENVYPRAGITLGKRF